ncbi:hypothetical protein TrVE_jg5686 [Triparma verrucosa]|uniref:Uncharacterized protein n=2 Tax=Triparma TaxID=722752 RepID=A0A9W7A1L1_9STRA|nr:hypothetical protein TrST_g680 [Triparma strigata]GMI13453.1 hypothetical protein TrVE_jg5686 [Triparma verrucosa]
MTDAPQDENFFLALSALSPETNRMIMRGLDAPPATSPSQGSALQEKTNVGSSPHARFAKGSTPVAKSANIFEKKYVRSVDIVEAREKEEKIETRRRKKDKKKKQRSRSKSRSSNKPPAPPPPASAPPSDASRATIDTTYSSYLRTSLSYVTSLVSATAVAVHVHIRAVVDNFYARLLGMKGRLITEQKEKIM